MTSIFDDDKDAQASLSGTGHDEGKYEAHSKEEFERIFRPVLSEMFERNEAHSMHGRVRSAISDEVIYEFKHAELEDLMRILDRVATMKVGPVRLDLVPVVAKPPKAERVLN
jgi:hypothetical protein